MNDVFENRVRAAAIAGWWTVLIAVGFITLIWIIYLVVMSARPAWLLTMWGPDVDWAFVQRVWFWAIVFLKFVVWLMALAAIWLTLWATAVAEAGRWTLAEFSPTCLSEPSRKVPWTSTNFGGSSASRQC